MKIEERIENLRKQGYCYQDIYKKLDMTSNERIAYERCLKNKRIAKPNFSISYLEFALLSIISITYLSLR